MDCTFLQDDNGKIWLHYITDIHVKEIDKENSKPFWIKDNMLHSDTSESHFEIQNLYLDALEQDTASKSLIQNEKSMLIKQTLSNVMYNNFEEIKK